MIENPIDQLQDWCREQNQRTKLQELVTATAACSMERVGETTVLIRMPKDLWQEIQEQGAGT